MAEYPKYPDKFHWRKRFLIPKTYLFKLRVVHGLTVKEITALHKSELGVKISERTVRYYLSKFKIFRPPQPAAKKKKPFLNPNFDQTEAVYYLYKCFRIHQSPFRYLGRLDKMKRKWLLGRFFKSLSKRSYWSQSQNAWLRRILKRYEVAPMKIDWIFPKRYVMVDWNLVDELRRERKITVHRFCKEVNMYRREYTTALRKGTLRLGRQVVLRMGRCFHFPITEISKEIKDE